MTILLIILVLFVVIYLGYKFYKKLYPDYTTLIELREYFIDDKEITISDIPETAINEGEQFSISFWIKTDNLPQNKVGSTIKHIMSRGTSFVVQFNPINGNFIFNIEYKKLDRSPNSDVYLDTYDIHLDTIPTQRWTNIIFCLDNSTIYLYVNGKIAKADMLPSVPFIQKRDIIIGDKSDNFEGYMADGRYYNYIVSDKEIKKIVNKMNS